MLIFDPAFAHAAFSLAEITRIGQPMEVSGQAEVRRVYLDRNGPSGRSFDLSEHEWKRLFRTPTQLIPAERGASLLYVLAEPDDENPMDYVERKPLIAWALCFDGHIRPVTAAGVNDGGDRDDPVEGWPIERPGGSVTCTDYEGTVFPNAAKYVAHLLAERKKGAA